MFIPVIRAGFPGKRPYAVPAVVVLSVEDFESLVETLAILQNPGDRAEFERARREADEGDVIDEEGMASLMRERLGKRDDCEPQDRAHPHGHIRARSRRNAT
jgi:hypothetical protein